jgi:ABC-2 type transport system ATP-binding protein
MSPAIEVRDLGKSFASGVEALRGVTFEVAPGEVFGYLGRNGQGKTTTVRILATLTAPTRGTARVAGHDVADEPHAVRDAIGVTMQSTALDPEMTGREHLELMAGLWGQPSHQARATASDWLEAFALTGAAARQIRTYSGGMKRRLDLAGALINRPAVLFLDEPTTGLDAQSRRSLWDRIRGMRDAGTTVFLTTQYLEEAEVLADRVAVLEAGQIVATDTVEGLMRTTGASTLEEAFLHLTGERAELQPVLSKGA